MRTTLPFGAIFRRWALLLGGIGLGSTAQAQALNYGLTGASNVAGTFTSIAASGTAITVANTDDANSAAQAIGFTFGFNGATFTQFVLNTNGFIKLGSSAPSAAGLFYTPENTIAGDAISSPSAADVNIVAPFHCDLQASPGGTSYRRLTTGTAPNRVCTIQWTNVQDKVLTNSTQYVSFSFQVKLYEGSNRIELVYGVPTAGTGTAAFRYAAAGLKGSGSAAGQVVLFSKASADAWSLATAQTLNYTGNTCNFRQTVLPDAGRTLRFDPQTGNDLAVGAVYTLGQAAQAFASPHVVRAAVFNNGSAASTSRTATLTVSGANSVTSTITVPPLAPGASTTLNFSSYPLTNLGTNTITVSIPGDDNNANNSATSDQVVSTNRLAYTDPALTTFTDGLGSGAANSLLYVKLRSNGPAFVTNITPTFFTATASTTFQVLVFDASGAGGQPGATPLYTSGTQTRGTTGGPVSVAVPNVAVNGDFYVATRQLAADNMSLAYQTESPLRSGTFYFSADGSAFTDLSASSFPARLAIQATLSPSAATCATVTGLAASAVTSNSATLTFTSVSGGLSYTLVLTPQGAAPITTTVSGSPVSLTALAGITNYTATVTTNCAGGATSTAATTSFTTLSGPLTNDECTTALPLTPGASCVPTPGSTTVATQSLPAIACAGFTGGADDDVWYRFVATATSHTVTVVGGATFDAVVDVRSGPCPGVNFACADATASGGTETVPLTGLTVGQTYYVRIYSYSTTVPGTFTVCVTAPTGPVCANPSNVTIANVTNASAQVTFTPAAGNTSYAVTYTPTGGSAVTVTPAPTASPITLSGLAPNTAYSLTFQAICAAGGTAPVLTGSFTTQAAAAPANDNPAGAVALPVNTACVTTAGTNVGATVTPPLGYTNPSTTPSTCGVAINPRDVWFRFTTLNGQTAATVTVTGTAAGQIRVFAAASSAGPFTQVGCAAGTTNNTVSAPAVLTGLLPNTTYYVSVAGFGSGDTQGPFSICVTGVGLPACLAPTNLTAGGLGTGSATLSFTPAAAGSSYTVTYTPSGGAPQTLTTTGSPVGLTGLLPATTYAVSVVSNCAGGQNSPAATTSFTTFTPCPAVTGLSASSIGTAGATLSFTPAAGAASYSVALTPVGGGATLTQSASGSPVVLTGLQPSTSYAVAVSTSCTNGLTSPAATASFTTLTPCAAVTGLSASSITPTGATLTFAGAPTGTSYNVTYTAAGGSPQTFSVTASPALLTGLTNGTSYTVSVVSNCGPAQTSPAATTSFTTTFPPCPAATGLAINAISTNGATLSFTPAAGGLSYAVSLTAQGGGTTTQTISGSPLALTGLQPSTSYTLTLTTNCASSQVSAAASVTFSTLAPCLAVTGLGAGSITTTSATLSFTPPASGATAFTVSYTAAGGGTQTVSATASPVVLTGLNSNTQYAVSVVSNCGATQTSPAATTTFVTATPPCPAVTTLSASGISTTGASIGFTPAAGAASYSVSLTPQGGSTTTQTISGSPLVLTGLQPGTSYAVAITTSCTTGLTSPPANLNFSTLAPCVAVTGLSAGSLTTTTATLTFAGAPTGTSYAITYTPTGGAPTTQTATASPVVLSGLLPGTAYAVSIVTSCGAGQTSPAAAASFTTLTPCPAVTGLSAGSIGTTGATLSFTPAAGAASYLVTVTPQGGAAVTQTVTASPVVLTGLQPGTTYAVTVATSCTNGLTSPLASTSFSTVPPCVAVSSLTAGSISPTGATLTFGAAPTGTSYTLTITPQGGAPTTQTATASPVVLTSLLPGTAYTVSVVTSCGAGLTSPPATVSFSTTTPPCPAVTGLSAGSLTATGAVLSFTPAAGGASYTVTYTAAGGSPQTLTATASPVTLPGLLAGTSYAVSVVTSCGAGQTSPAATTSFLTPAPAPTSPVAGSVTDSGASIAFGLAAGATGYTVTYTPQGGAPVTVTVTGSPVVLTGLTALTSYSVSIVANYPGGATSPPVTLTFSTLQTTAIRGSLANGIPTVAPNPAHTAFTLTLPALGPLRTAHLELVNALGQTVRTQAVALTPGGTQVPMSAEKLASGVYLLRIAAGHETATVRLLVE